MRHETYWQYEGSLPTEGDGWSIAGVTSTTGHRDGITFGVGLALWHRDIPAEPARDERNDVLNVG